MFMRALDDPPTDALAESARPDLAESGRKQGLEEGGLAGRICGYLRRI